MNETGKGGFADHPENRNIAGRPKFSLVSIIRGILQEVPEGEKKEMAERLIRAYVADAEARKDGVAIRDIIDRIDGKPQQHVKVEDERREAWRNLLKDAFMAADDETTSDNPALQEGETEVTDSGGGGTERENLAE